VTRHTFRAIFGEKEYQIRLSFSFDPTTIP